MSCVSNPPWRVFLETKSARLKSGGSRPVTRYYLSSLTEDAFYRLGVHVAVSTAAANGAAQMLEMYG